MSPIRTIRLAATLVVALAARAVAAQSALPSDAAIRALLADRIDTMHKSVGMVVGIVTPQGRRVIGYGRLDRADPRTPDASTVFEIGSVTKVFTSLLLADMVRRGEVRLDDPAAKYLPKGTTLPTRNGRPITLLDLATNTSGLPFAPTDFPVRDGAKYATYSDTAVDRFLRTYALPAEPGTQWTYSNLGVGLLGRALAGRAGKRYETLLRERVLGPLGMGSTAITPTARMRAATGRGHDTTLDTTPDWSLPPFEAASSLRSTANDLLTFLEAAMGLRRTALAPALASMLRTRRPGPNLQQALGWWIIPFGPGDSGIVTHSGETFGYSSVVAYDPAARTGIVLLSNGSENDGGLVWHLLRPAFPYATSSMAKARPARQEIAVDPAVLDGYVGQYAPPGTPPGGALTIERRGDGLTFESPATPPDGLRLHAASATTFFITEAELQVIFEVGVDGRATALVVRFGGTDTRAPRIAKTP